MFNKVTDYVFWYFDPRGAWRESSVHTSSREAKANARTSGYAAWYIEERKRSIIALSPKAHAMLNEEKQKIESVV